MKSKLLILLAAVMICSCSTRKSEVRKKEESVSVLQEKDIRKTETEKVKTDLLRISFNQDISLSPRDPDKEMKVVYGDDTLVATNADIRISNRQETESDQTETETEKEESDQSATQVEAENEQKEKDNERQSASWGANIGIILGVIVSLGLLFLYFKTKRPDQ